MGRRHERCAWPKWSTESNIYPGYLFQLFSTVYGDIIELLNRRYNLVTSIFAPFLRQLSLPLINDATSNVIALRVNCHTLPLMVKTVCNSVTVKLFLRSLSESDRKRSIKWCLWGVKIFQRMKYKEGERERRKKRERRKRGRIALTFDGMVDIMVTLCPRAAKAFINA